MRGRYNLLFIAFCLIFVLASCTKDPSINATRLQIKLTDAPMDTRAEAIVISEFNVDIQKIEVSATDSLGENEDWVTLDFNGGVYNILPLTNGKSKQIADQYFPAGILRRLRVHYGNNSSISIRNGEPRELILEPGYENGVEYEVNTTLYPHYISSIMIDINAQLSLYEQNGNYFFKPDARVFAEAFGGSLKGFAGPPDASPAVIITNEKEALFSIPEFSDGMFKFIGLEEGEWEIYVYSQSGTGYVDTVFTDSIYSGKTTNLKSKITLKKYTPPVEGGDDDDGEDPEDNYG